MAAVYKLWDDGSKVVSKTPPISQSGDTNVYSISMLETIWRKYRCFGDLDPTMYLYFSSVSYNISLSVPSHIHLRHYCSCCSGTHSK